ncbi:TetR/AcrR family transcriptional regulator [Cohnella abietis]|uniref:TetR family transcriptional regulator n=1 Tax=Cohnella abietis TaxID=2507935 RepID=A0A3T1D698_9BACL|nr:TetR/AcrR family transcriptional regulator [Cohnella abietis]BBI33602.1 TetR family transcriptional regulator [Cohnella abietis]
MEIETKIDRRIIRTKEAINKAFLELFSEKELEQITINDIADRANVNRGTIYLHYIDKYDLLDKCIEEHLRRLITFCSRNELNQEITPLVSDLKPVFDYFGTNYLFFSAMLNNQRTSVFRERLQHFVSVNLKEKLDRQDLQPEIDNELNAQFMASAFVGILEWWIRNKMPHTPEYMAEQVRKLYEKNEVFPMG